MKHLISVALLLFMLTTIKGQAYQPILSDSLTWYGTFFRGGFYDWVYYQVYGDTLIDGKNYQIIDKYHYNKLAFLREDTAARQLFYRHTKGYRENEDILLYDFSLQVGEGMNLYNPNSHYPDSAGYFIVDSISSVLIANGQNNRVFYLSNDNLDGAVWIEGVGSLGVINAPSAIPDIEDLHITCLFKENDLYFQSQTSIDNGTCEILTLDVGENKREENIVVYPNPTSGKVNIELRVDYKNADIRIINASGQLVHRSSIQDQRILSINNEFSPGIYFIQMTLDGQVHHKKLIVR